MSTLEQKQMVLGGVAVTYYAVKPLNAQNSVLVFLHGWRSRSDVWFPAMRDLAQKEYQSYAIDLPGFGKSEAPRAVFTLDAYAVVVREFIQRLRLGGVVLIGHSFGGRVAIKLASAHPALMQKLVLVDSAGIRMYTWKLTVKRILAKLLKPFFRLPPLRSLRARIYAMMGAEDYVATPRLTQTFLNVLNEDLAPRLSAVNCPTLLVWGQHDTETPLWHAHRMQSLVPHAQLVVLPGMGHFSFLDQPEAFINALEQFLA